MPNFRKAAIAISFLCVSLFSCSNTRINYYPKYLGLKYSETLLLSEIQDAGQNSQSLPLWAKEKIQKEIPSIKVVSSTEVFYKMKQYGVDLNSIADKDTLSFQLINEKTGINYLLSSRILSRNDNNFDELHNPQYGVKQAVLEFRLIDLKTGLAVWKCTTATNISPLIRPSGDQRHYHNIMSSSAAIAKAYRKSVRRLLKCWGNYGDNI